MLRRTLFLAAVLLLALPLGRISPASSLPSPGATTLPRAAGIAGATYPHDAGERLVTHTDETGTLWVGSADGVHDQPVFSRGRVWQAAWSPSGARLAVAAGDYDDPDLWIMRPDGSEPVSIGRGAAPVWSPDEKTLVFNERNPRGDGSERLAMAGVDGSERQFLTAGLLPRWSPDGRFLAFLRPLGQWEGPECPNLILLVRDLAGARDTELGPAGTSFAWLPDSSLVFATAAGDLVRFVPSAGVSLLAAGSQARHCQAPFVAAPSGSFVAHVTRDDQLGLMDVPSGRT